MADADDDREHPALARVLRLDEQLCFALYTASRLVTRAYRPLLEALGLTYPQYLVLLVLFEEAPDGERAVSVGRLGERLFLDSGTLTPLLKRMEAAGLVRRARSSVDERVLEVRLTPAGQALEAEARHVPLTLLCEAEASPAELVDLRDRVRRLIASLEPEAADR
jgi:DNA-binding MarR family transcriptional regulator